MATLTNTVINDTGFLRLPRGTSAQRPSGTQGYVRYNTDTGNAEYFTDLQSRGWAQMTIPFLTRQIITTGYTVGGYRDVVTWRNVNRTVSATDVTYDLGDQIGRSHNYKSSFCSKTIHWTFGAGNAHATSSNVTTAFNMVTESSYSTPAGANMAVSRGHSGCLFREYHTGWVTGGTSGQIEKFDGATEVFITYSGGSTAIAGTGGASEGGPWGISHETYGIYYLNSSSAQNFTFATETISTRGGVTPANSNQQKSIQSKLTNAYAGNEGTFNGGNTYRRTNMITNISVAAGITKAHTNTGEENMTLGQDHQYYIGQFDGAQNNLAAKFTYGTETSIAGSASMESKGVPGRSSATMGWRE